MDLEVEGWAGIRELSNWFAKECVYTYALCASASSFDKSLMVVVC